jgi:hypothetical protein
MFIALCGGLDANFGFEALAKLARRCGALS